MLLATTERAGNVLLKIVLTKKSLILGSFKIFLPQDINKVVKKIFSSFTMATFIVAIRTEELAFTGAVECSETANVALA